MQPFLPTLQALVELSTGVVTESWRKFFEGISGSISDLTTTVGAIPGSAQGTFAGRPTGLGAGDAGRLYMLTDYGHLVRWSGLKWTFAGGDAGNGKIEWMAVAPADTSYWQECDGTVTDYLTVGAADLSVTSFTTPNLKGTPAFAESGAAYTGTITAASAPGATATAPTISGNTGDESAHTHTVPNAHTHTFTTSGNIGNRGDMNSTGASFVPTDGHTHSGTTANGGAAETSGAGSAHHHDGSTLAASTPAVTVDATGKPARITLRPFFRR